MHPDLVVAVSRQNGVFTRAQALRAGYTVEEVRGLVRSGTWVSLRRGILTTAEHHQACDSDLGAHRLAAAAAIAGLGCLPVVSHRSAALLWGLPLLGPSPDSVQLTTSQQNRRRTAGLEMHTARTPEHHRAVVDGLPVTSAARTLSDLARSLPLRDAVVAADAALHRGLCTMADVDQVIRDCWTWRGIARTKRMCAATDERAESPGESLSRIAIAEAGLPVPELQTTFVLEGRTVRVDFYWPEHGLVGEFDGRVKYGEASSLWDEKLREDLLRRSQRRVVRWIWSELHPRPSLFIGRLAAALRQGS